ncbi:MAG: hypothetical protein GY751_06825, partial [Bacteroidetes bacterium]|nr:hypothetical protein [Bacteroidota bacterium]
MNAFNNLTKAYRKLLTVAKWRYITIVLMSLLLHAYSAEAQTGACSDSVVNQDVPWLDNIVDSMEIMGCPNNCYDQVSVYCSEGDIIYALETGNICADVPIVYYDAAGNVICMDGTIAGSDGDTTFISGLVYLYEYWTCSDVPGPCESLVAVINIP